MLEVDIPGYASLRLKHLVLDYNGTLAVDGALLPGVRRRMRALSRVLEIHVVTADTFGSVRAALKGLPCRVSVLPARGQDRAKRAYVRRLAAARTACIGNGRNDRLMVEAAALGVAVLQGEGSAAATLAAADIVVPAVTDALDLLVKPLRLVASLRS
jgi:soluble P-type ATPase